MFPVAHPLHLNIKRGLCKPRVLKLSCKMVNRLGLILLFTVDNLTGLLCVWLEMVPPEEEM